jgi:tellurite resistance-related uncharacterized protein
VRAYGSSVQPVARAVTGFHQDPDGVWVAELSCGHTQHVRHAPPFQERPWVQTQAGRDAHLGSELACPSCAMPELPASLTLYKQTADFDQRTLPAGLRSRHALKAGTWGRIVVLEGRLLYVIEGTSELSFVLRPDLPGVVPPEVPHHVAPRGEVRFRIEMYRVEP